MEEKSSMGLLDLVKLNIVAIFGVAFFASAAKMGPAEILLWIIAAVLFFVPEGLIVAELSTAWPLEGGLGAWCNEAFDKRTGFLISWAYFINNVIYFPALLMSTSVFLAYALDMPALADNKVFVSVFSILFYWALTFANIRGFNISKSINNFSSYFAFGVTLLLLGLAVYWVFGLGQPVQTRFTVKSMIPRFSDLGGLVFFSNMLFALAGLELSPSLVGRIQDPKKNFPRAILITSLVLPVLFIVGTTSLVVVMSPEKVGLTTGLMSAISLVTEKAGIAWFGILVAVIIFLFRIGSVNAWLLTPVLMFVEGYRDYLPSWLARKDERYHSPKNALIVQACVVSFLTLMAYSMPTAEAAYWLIAAMATILYFLPFMALFLAFIVLRRKYPDQERVYRVPAGNLVALVGFLAVAVSVVLACLPPDGVEVGEIVLYEAKLLGGAAFFLLLGYLLYLRHGFSVRKAAAAKG